MKDGRIAQGKRIVGFVDKLGLIVLLLSYGACASAWAQSTAQISGTVKDQTGAVLPGTEVKATQTATGAVRTVLSGEDGGYLLPNLSIGPYMVEVSLPGFRTYLQTGIVLQVNSSSVVNATLEVGQVSDSVEVQADAALVETRSTGVGTVIDNQRVLEMPLNGRNVTELIFLAGMANPGNNGLQSSTRNYPTSVISVAGGLNNGLNYVLDGGTHNDPINSLTLPMPFPDALQEFKVETSALPAQYGQHSAGTMNAVTKSGTNTYHGDLFEFVRNSSLNARNAFALNDDGLKRNQFGGTVGGPIMKNKLFFFAGYQGTIVRSAPSTARAFIPTAAMLSGDFTTVASPACNNGRQINLAAPFVGNKIAPSAFTAPALNMVKALPPTNDPCGLIQFGGRANSDEKVMVGKVDYQRSDKHSLFGRYYRAHLDTPSNFDGTNFLSATLPTLDQTVHSFVLGDTYLIGGGMVSSFRGTLLRTRAPRFGPPIPDFGELGVKNIFVGFPKYSKTTISNGFNLGGGSSPGFYNSTAYQFAEDLSLLRGAHQVGFGVNFIHKIFNGSSGDKYSPAFTFNGQFTGMGLADFMIGKPDTFQQGGKVEVNPRQSYIGMYLQDTWKTNSRLTVNAGVRWEPFISAYDSQQRQTYFDKAAFDKGVRSTIYTKAPIGLLFPGDPGVEGTKYGANHLLHFVPRVGLAWDPSGDGKMTVRAAYGIFFDMEHLWYYRGTAQAAPYASLVLLNSPAGGFEDPWQGYPGGNPFPLFLNRDIAFPLTVAYASFRQDAKPTYVHEWNLSVQRQIGTDWLVSGNYVGNSTIHLWSDVEVNPVIYIPGASCVIAGRTYTPCSSTSNTQQRRLLSLQNPVEGPYYAMVTESEDGGTSNYNAMLLSIQRRRSRGLTVQGNYTLSHCIGDSQGTQPGGGTSVVAGRRQFERANCGADKRHSFNLSTVYETPQFATPSLRVLASGWQLSGIFRVQSGSYFGVQSGFDTALTASTGSNRANQVLGDPYPANKSIDQWLNPLAFARPATGEYGTASNNILGPGSIQLDMGLSRTFAVRENQSLQFRVEAFNLPNHLNPGSPITALNNQNFGKIQTALDPRIMQLALKYVF